MRNKVIDIEEAAARVPDGAAVGILGGGGGLVEPEALLEAIEERFLSTGRPNGLRVIHALGLGDRDRRGLNRLAYEGLVSKVIGGHWIWSPRMQALAREEKIEAYVLPSGVTTQLFREIGAGRPGLITHVGLGTFVDPRQDGGRMNRSAQDTLVELIEIEGRTLLRYRPFPVDVAVLRGSYADADGNISMEEEPANLESFALALAAHNSGGDSNCSGARPLWTRDCFRRARCGFQGRWWMRWLWYQASNSATPSSTIQRFPARGKGKRWQRRLEATA